MRVLAVRTRQSPLGWRCALSAGGCRGREDCACAPTARRRHLRSRNRGRAHESNGCGSRRASGRWPFISTISRAAGPRSPHSSSRAPWPPAATRSSCWSVVRAALCTTRCRRRSRWSPSTTRLSGRRACSRCGAILRISGRFWAASRSRPAPRRPLATWGRSRQRSGRAAPMLCTPRTRTETSRRCSRGALLGVDTRIVVTERNAFHDGHLQRGWSGQFLPGLVRRMYGQAEAVVAVSDGVADELAAWSGLPRAQIVTIYNPVVTDELIAGQSEPVDHPWFQPGMPPVIMSAGRLGRAKDHPTLIRAFARVRRARPARLVIFGQGKSDGEDRKECRRAAGAGRRARRCRRCGAARVRRQSLRLHGARRRIRVVLDQ